MMAGRPLRPTKNAGADDKHHLADAIFADCFGERRQSLRVPAGLRAAPPWITCKPAVNRRARPAR